MARLIIDTGVVGNAATGDTLRTAMTKANDNFSELYTDLAATTSANGNLTNSDTNGNVKIFANGTGIVEIDRLSIILLMPCSIILRFLSKSKHLKTSIV